MERKSTPVRMAALAPAVFVSAFVLTAIAVVLLVNHTMRQRALDEAEAKAVLLINRNLATHAFYSHQLKPALLDLTELSEPADAHQPVWMSSTYAVREIQDYFSRLSGADYRYKECAVNARNPQNEADPYERRFLEDLNEDPGLERHTGVRDFEGKSYYTVLLRGEVMQESCLLCHDEPKDAPEGLVDRYGSRRGFGREVGETVSAISVSIPLEQAYAAANRFSMELSALLLVLLAILSGAQYLFSRRLVFNPLSRFRDKAVGIASDERRLGETIEPPFGRELADLAEAFNAMSTGMHQTREELEERVKARTEDIARANRQLKREIEERRLAGQALKRSEERFRFLVEAAQAGILVHDTTTEIVECNTTALRIIGVEDKDELIGLKAGDAHWRLFREDGGIMPPEEYPVNRVIDTGRPVRETVAGLNRGDPPETVWLLINADPQFDESGRLSQIIVTLVDISERKREEEQRIEKIRQELRSFEHLHEEARTAVSARLYGVLPLRDRYSELFENMVRRYGELLDESLQSRAYKTDRDLSEPLKALADELGALRAGPRDVVDVHTSALKRKEPGLASKKAQAYAEEGRLMALQLMGFLVSFYRRHAAGSHLNAGPEEVDRNGG